jgi:hypothetical protein
VAQVCIPSCLGVGDGDYHNLRPPQAKTSETPSPQSLNQCFGTWLSSQLCARS